MMQTQPQKTGTVSSEKPNEIVLPQNYRYYQKIIYDYIKENHPGIIKIARIFIERVKNDFDNHATIEGGTGSGKSAFTFILVCVMHELINKTFNINKHCLFIPDEGELRRKVRSLDRYGVIWLDEAIRSLDKKKWFNADQIDLNQTVKTERWRNNTIFYNIQRFAELTETFRNDNIFLRIFIIERYAAVLYIKDRDKDIDDPWHIKRNISIKYKNKWGATRYNPMMSTEKRLHKERTLPNYVMDTRYPNPEDIPGAKIYWDFYKQLKQQSRVVDKQKDEKKITSALPKYTQQVWRDLTRVVDFAKAKLGLTAKEIHHLVEMEASLDNMVVRMRTARDQGRRDVPTSMHINNTNKKEGGLAEV